MVLHNYVVPVRNRSPALIFRGFLTTSQKKRILFDESRTWEIGLKSAVLQKTGKRFKRKRKFIFGDNLRCTLWVKIWFVSGRMPNIRNSTNRVFWYIPNIFPDIYGWLKERFEDVKRWRPSSIYKAKYKTGYRSVYEFVKKGGLVFAGAYLEGRLNEVPGKHFGKLSDKKLR